METKNLEFEIKSIDDKGFFKGVASPFNNVDYGDDRVLPSISKRNNSKEVPYLWQHDSHDPIGKVKLVTTKTGVGIEGKLFLDTNEGNIPLIPNAQKAYVLMKNGQLKNSIGYNILDFEYVTEGKQTIRNLKDIDIMEVSAVTFPMNDKATIDSVKESRGVKMEEKAMGFSQLLQVQNANEMRWKLTDALHSSLRQLISDETMTEDEKVAQLNTNVDDFAKAYKENMTALVKLSGKNKTAKKSILDDLETKESVQPTEPVSQQTEEKDDTIETKDNENDLFFKNLSKIFETKEEANE